MASRSERLRCGLVAVLALVGTLLSGPAHEWFHPHPTAARAHEARCCARVDEERSVVGAVRNRPHLHSADEAHGGELPCALCSAPRFVPAPPVVSGPPAAGPTGCLDRPEAAPLRGARAREARGRAPPQTV